MNRTNLGIRARTTRSSQLAEATVHCVRRGFGGQKRRLVGVVVAAQGVVVQRHAADTPVGGQHPRLRLDLLRGEDAADRREQRVAVEQVEVAGELLHAVDLAASLDLHRDRDAVGVPREQVHRADRRSGTPAGPASSQARASRSGRRAAPGGGPRRRPSAGPDRGRARASCRAAPPRRSRRAGRRSWRGPPSRSRRRRRPRRTRCGTAGSSSSAACTPGRRHGPRPIHRP